MGMDMPSKHVFDQVVSLSSAVFFAWLVASSIYDKGLSPAMRFVRLGAAALVEWVIMNGNYRKRKLYQKQQQCMDSETSDDE